jgi:hypothetical protein
MLQHSALFQYADSVGLGQLLKSALFVGSRQVNCRSLFTACLVVCLSPCQVALHPGQVLAALPSGRPGYAAVDRVHLMTYDMVGPASRTGTAAAQGHASAADAEAAARHQLEQSGLAAAKLVLGVPAYARHLRNPGAVRWRAG